VTTTYEPTTNSQRPTDGSGFTESPEKAEFPALFWAAVILFVVNLIVLAGIWLSPDLRVSLYGQDEGTLAGSYAKPSAFTERVEVATARKVRQPEKMRPVFSQVPAAAEESALSTPGTVIPVSSNGTLDAQRVVETYSNFPRMTASAAHTTSQIVHAGTLEVSPRRVTEQP
jgi:hypothetical protein